MHPRVLIVGTIPYNKNTSSRAFDAYFHNWEKENIRQIFSNTKKPPKGHCGELYQITDQRVLKCKMHRIKEPGIIYKYEDLEEDWQNNDLEVNSNVTSRLYKLGSKKKPIIYLARHWLWKRKHWETKQLRDWLDNFKPECVFLAFSDDFFINDIAIYVADRFNIPIICCIGDDYYFNDRCSISPFYHIYRRLYKKTIDKVFSHRCTAIYISNKIRDKYNSYFGIGGETVYLCSDINRHEFRPINKESPYITYCGNIRVGRNYSLVDIANALQQINDNYQLTVYTAEKNKEYIKPLKKCKAIDFKGEIPYKDVVTVFDESDIVVIVEGFKKKDVNITKYSLSTKAADSLTSGCQIIAYGSDNCGVIEYMRSTGASVVSCSKFDLKEKILELIENESIQKQMYMNSKRALEENHNLIKSNLISERLIGEMVANKNDK